MNQAAKPSKPSPALEKKIREILEQKNMGAVKNMYVFDVKKN